MHYIGNTGSDQVHCTMVYTVLGLPYLVNKILNCIVPTSQLCHRICILCRRASKMSGLRFKWHASCSNKRVKKVRCFLLPEDLHTQSWGHGSFILSGHGSFILSLSNLFQLWYLWWLACLCCVAELCFH